VAPLDPALGKVRLRFEYGRPDDWPSRILVLEWGLPLPLVEWAALGDQFEIRTRKVLSVDEGQLVKIPVQARRSWPDPPLKPMAVYRTTSGDSFWGPPAGDEVLQPFPLSAALNVLAQHEAADDFVSKHNTSFVLSAFRRPASSLQGVVRELLWSIQIGEGCAELSEGQNYPTLNALISWEYAPLEKPPAVKTTSLETCVRTAKGTKTLAVWEGADHPWLVIDDLVRDLPMAPGRALNLSRDAFITYSATMSCLGPSNYGVGWSLADAAGQAYHYFSARNGQILGTRSQSEIGEPVRAFPQECPPSMPGFAV
jgi:hypothetical protein